MDEQSRQRAGFFVARGTAPQVLVHGGVTVVGVAQVGFDVGVHLREAVVAGQPRGRVEEVRVDGCRTEGPRAWRWCDAPRVPAGVLEGWGSGEWVAVLGR